MNTRNVTLLIKQNNQPSSALPASAATGEALMNTADGKVYSKGFISGTGATTFVPSLLNGAFFEVGSHLSQLKLDDKIITYSGVSNLSGLFLSGTSSGFVLSPISNIATSDTYPTGVTFTNNILTITNNNSGPVISTFVNNFSGLTINGFLSANTIASSNVSATTVSATTLFINGTQLTGDSSTTGGTYNPSTGVVSFTKNNGVSYTAGTWNYVSAATLANNVLSITSNGGTPTNTTINAATGGTYANGVITLSGSGIVGTITGLISANTFTTAATFTNNILILTNNSGGTVTATINNFTGLTVNGPLSANTISGGTFYGNGAGLTGLNATTLTSFTYNNANQFSIVNNTGGTLSSTFNIVTGLTVNGNLTTTGNTFVSGNTFNNGNVTANNLYTSTSGAAVIGTGGMTIGSGGSEGVPGVGNLVVNGSLIVFGTSVSAFTSNLYAEDNVITLNYNPTGDTYASSLGGGMSVQNGLGVNGITGDTVSILIAQTGVPVNQGDAYAKRFWETTLFNFMLGSSGGTGTGNYVLQATDILNGGAY